MPAGLPDRLNNAARLYYREAQTCSRGKAYLAAIVMHAASLEATLQAMCTLYDREAKATATFRAKKFRTKRKVLELSLNQLINLSAEAGWFPSKQFTWAGKRASVAGFTHEVRKVRNLVHPGIWAKEPHPMKITKGVLRVTDEILEVANSWLLHRVEQSLLKAMRRKKWNRLKRSGSIAVV